MMVPRNTMDQELKGQEKELSDDISSLNKKVCSAYSPFVL
jgi:prefoldin subunit 1